MLGGVLRYIDKCRLNRYILGDISKVVGYLERLNVRFLINKLPSYIGCSDVGVVGVMDPKDRAFLGEISSPPSPCPCDVAPSPCPCPIA